MEDAMLPGAMADHPLDPSVLRVPVPRTSAAGRLAGPMALGVVAIFLGAAHQAPAPVQERLVLETLSGKQEIRPAASPGEFTFGPRGTVFLRYEGPRPEMPRSPARLVLSDGQRWMGGVAGGSGDTLRFSASLGAQLSVSVDHVARLEFDGRLPDADRGSLTPAAEGDRLYWVHDGALERVDGSFEAFADEGVVLTGVLGKRTFPWDEVGALLVAALEEGQAPARPEGIPLVVDTDDGSRIAGAFVGPTGADDAGSRPPGFELETAFGARVRVPFARVWEAALDDGCFAYLSDLPPARAQAGSLFGDELGLSWPHQVDRSVVGTPLSVAGRRQARGLGVHAPSRLVWDLGPAAGSEVRPARELAGEVGIDDSVRTTSARGCVRFQVHVDGVLRWDSGPVRGGEEARPIPRIDLRGAKELALVVEQDEDSFVADRADWLRLLLVREP